MCALACARRAVATVGVSGLLLSHRPSNGVAFSPPAETVGWQGVYFQKLTRALTFTRALRLSAQPHEKNEPTTSSPSPPPTKKKMSPPAKTRAAAAAAAEPVEVRTPRSTSLRACVASTFVLCVPRQGFSASVLVDVRNAARGRSQSTRDRLIARVPPASKATALRRLARARCSETHVAALRGTLSNAYKPGTHPLSSTRYM